MFDAVLLPFFSHENGVLRVGVVREVIQRLNVIRAWFRTQNSSFSFRSSSILIVYETSSDPAAGPFVDVRMIDFAHVLKLENGLKVDENYLHGLENLIEFLNALLS